MGFSIKIDGHSVKMWPDMRRQKESRFIEPNSSHLVGLTVSYPVPRPTAPPVKGTSGSCEKRLRVYAIVSLNLLQKKLTQCSRACGREWGKGNTQTSSRLLDGGPEQAKPSQFTN